MIYMNTKLTICFLKYYYYYYMNKNTEEFRIKYLFINILLTFHLAQSKLWSLNI